MSFGKMVRRAFGYVCNKGSKFAVALCGGVLFGIGSSAMAADPVAITLDASPIDWAASSTALLTYLSSNLTPILGLTLGIVAIVVVFRWLVKGASGRA